jgi:hypothetical protein
MSINGVNWSGLLAWSTKYHDGTKDTSEFKAMSEEDRNFLMGAMEEAFGKMTDPNEVMQEAIQKLREGLEKDDEPLILTALEIMDSCCDDPDPPRNFAKLGGVEPILKACRQKSPVIRARSCEMIGVILQHNPEVQQATLDADGLSVFLEGAVEDVAYLTALSALVKGFVQGETALVAAGGVDVLAAVLEAPNARAGQKAATLLRLLATESRLGPAHFTRVSEALAVAYSVEIQESRADNIQACEVFAELVLAMKTKGPVPPGVASRLEKAAADPDFAIEVETLKRAIG